MRLFKLPRHRPYQHPSSSPQLFEEFGLHHNRLLWELSLPQNFVVARSHHINDWSGSSLVFGSIYLCVCSPTKVHSLPRLTERQTICFFFKW